MKRLLNILLFILFVSPIYSFKTFSAAAFPEESGEDTDCTLPLSHIQETDPRKISLLIGKSTDKDQEHLTGIVRSIASDRRWKFVKQAKSLMHMSIDYKGRVKIAISLGEIPEDDRDILTHALNRILRSNNNAAEIIKLMQTLHATTRDHISSIVDEIVKILVAGRITPSILIESINTYSNTRSAYRPILSDLVLKRLEDHSGKFNHYGSDERLKLVNIVGSVTEDKQENTCLTLFNLSTPAVTPDNMKDMVSIVKRMPIDTQSKVRIHVPRLYIPGFFTPRNLYALLENLTKVNAGTIEDIVTKTLSLKAETTDERLKLGIIVSDITERSLSDVTYWASMLYKNPFSFDLRESFLRKISEIEKEGLITIVPRMIYRINAEINTGIIVLGGWPASRRISEIFEDRSEGPIPFTPGATAKQIKDIQKHEAEQSELHDWDRRKHIFLWRAVARPAYLSKTRKTYEQ